MLTEHEREYVKSIKKRQQYTKSVQRQYDYRIRKKTRQMLEDLRFLAMYLPEDEQKQIFNERYFIPMVEAILNPNRPDITKDLSKKLRTAEFRRKLIFVKNERMFKLCNKLIDIATRSGIQLIPNEIATTFMLGIENEKNLEIVRRIGQFFK